MQEAYSLYVVMSLSKTTIAMTKEIRERLKALGKKGETYADIIEHMLNKQERKRVQKDA